MIWAKVAVAALAWLTAAPLPQPRTEVGAAVVRGRIVVVGGLTAAGVPSARADALSPATGRWRRLPDLPVAVHHPLVASGGGSVYVAGGYGGRLGAGERLRTVFAFDGRRWHRHGLGVVAVGTRIYAIGGGPTPGLAVSGADEYLDLE